MLSIKKTGEGYYLVSLSNSTEELDRNNSYTVKKELSPIVRPHRVITFDVKGVKSINNGGYKILQELVNMAHTKRCKIKFINIEPSVSNKIANLTGKLVKLQKELEID